MRSLSTIFSPTAPLPQDPRRPGEGKAATSEGGRAGSCTANQLSDLAGEGREVSSKVEAFDFFAREGPEA